jgi:hypothetical protein
METLDESGTEYNMNTRRDCGLENTPLLKK